MGYVRDASKSLVDLMSLTNVSAFILTEKYFGYYIHGQSNLPNADTSLKRIAKILEDEAKSITSSRGLMPNDESQCQTFIMHITPEVRENYDNFFEEVQKDVTTQRTGKNIAAQLDEELRERTSRGMKAASNPLYDALKGTNTLLKKFVKKMQTEHADQIQ